MNQIVYLEAYENYDEYKKDNFMKLPLESLITYCVYKFCCPENIDFIFVNTFKALKDSEVAVKISNLEAKNFTDNVSWQVSSCKYPVLMNGDTVITGLCAVGWHMSWHRTGPASPIEHEDGILGFRRGCLQAPNEVSVWTKFCEVDLVKTVQEILKMNTLHEVPINLVRFENHLRKPVRIHNVYKYAKEVKKRKALKCREIEQKSGTEEKAKKDRVPKGRKWKSSISQEIAVDCSTKIQDLDISHQFAEGPFLTLADIVLTPLYFIVFKMVGDKLESLLPLTSRWFKNMEQLPELADVFNILTCLEKKQFSIYNCDITVPVAEDVSLYKRDPKRHNPKKRQFTKGADIENALNSIVDSMHITVVDQDFSNRIDWSAIPDGAKPSGGHLPHKRMERKEQQLEYLALAVQTVAKDGDLIVDFCSGSGHLGILIAYLMPKCTVILLENKEQSLFRARKRVHEMGMKNVFFFQCNLSFFIGKFNVGVGLHACGTATDLILDKCLQSNANFVLCPCCYGSLHATDKLVYPRSKVFSSMTIEQYMAVRHLGDQTHKDCPLTKRGDWCMAVIDSDRLHLAIEFGYNVTLSRLKPLSCTPKNNLLIGVSNKSE